MVQISHAAPIPHHGPIQKTNPKSVTHVLTTTHNASLKIHCLLLSIQSPALTTSPSPRHVSESSYAQNMPAVLFRSLEVVYGSNSQGFHKIAQALWQVATQRHPRGLACPPGGFTPTKKSRCRQSRQRLAISGVLLRHRANDLDQWHEHGDDDRTDDKSQKNDHDRLDN